MTLAATGFRAASAGYSRRSEMYPHLLPNLSPGTVARRASRLLLSGEAGFSPSPTRRCPAPPRRGPAPPAPVLP